MIAPQYATRGFLPTIVMLYRSMTGRMIVGQQTTKSATGRMQVIVGTTDAVFTLAGSAATFQIAANTVVMTP